MDAVAGASRRRGESAVLLLTSGTRGGRGWGRAPQRGEVHARAEIREARALQRMHLRMASQRLQRGRVGRVAAIVHHQRAAAGRCHAARQVARHRHGLRAHLHLLQRIACARSTCLQVQACCCAPA